MESKSESFLKYLDSYKPVGWSWSGSILMYVATGGFGVTALLGNKLATKYSVDGEKDYFAKLKSLDPEFWSLVNTIETQIKEFKLAQSQLDFLGDGYLRTKKGKLGVNLSGEESEVNFYQTLKLSKENLGRGQGNVSLKLISIQNTCNQLLAKLQELPLEVQDLFDPNIIQEITNFANNNQLDKISEEVKKLREQFPAQITGNQKDKTNRNRRGSEAVILPSKNSKPKEKLVANAKSNSFTLASVAISTLVAYSPIFTSLGISSPIPLKALENQIRLGNPTATAINNRIRTPIYQSIGSAALETQKLYQSFTTSLPNFLNWDAEKRFNPKEYHPPITADSEQAPKTEMHNIIGLDAYKDYTQLKPENLYSSNSGILGIFQRDQEKKQKNDPDISIAMLEGGTIFSTYRETLDKTKFLLPEILTLQKAKQLIELPQNANDKNYGVSLDLDRWNKRVTFYFLNGDDQKVYNISKNFYIHPKLAQYLDLQSIDINEIKTGSVAIKPGMEKLVEEIFKANGRTKYNSDKIKDTYLYPSSKIKKAKYVHNNNDPKERLFKFTLEDFEYFPLLKKFNIVSFLTSRVVKDNRLDLGIILDEENSLKLEALIKAKNGLEYNKINIKSVDDLEPNAIFFSTEKVESKRFENPNIGNVLLNGSMNPEELLKMQNEANKFESASFAVTYILTSKTQAVLRFPNTKAIAYADFPVKLEDENTYLELSPRKKDENGDEFINPKTKGLVTVVYTPIKETEAKKLINNSYNTTNNSEFTPSELSQTINNKTSIIENNNLISSVLEVAPDSLKIKIAQWKDKINLAKSEKELLDIVKEVQQYVISNNYYGSSNQINEVIKSSDGDATKIFKVLATNMERQIDKENISCATANSLFQTILWILEFDAHQSSGFHDNGDGKLTSNESHSWTEVAIKSDKGRTNFRIADATPTRRQGQEQFSIQNTNKEFEILIPLIGGVGLGFMVIKRIKKKFDPQKNLPEKPKNKINKLNPLKPPNSYKANHQELAKFINPNDTTMPKFPKIPYFSQIIERIKKPPSEIEKISNKLSLESLIVARKILTTTRYSGSPNLSEAELSEILETSVVQKNAFSPKNEVLQIESGVSAILKSPIALEYTSNLDSYENIIKENISPGDRTNISKLIRAIRKQASLIN